MKKKSTLSVLFICLFAATQTSVAQINKKSISDFFNSEKVNQVVDAISNKGVSFESIQGKWIYQEPACKLEGDDLLAKAGSSLLNSQIEKQLADVCSKVGIEPNLFFYQLNSDSTFVSSIKNKEVKGTYSFDESSQTIAFKYGKLGKLGKLTTFKATVNREGNDLLLLFDADKLLNLVSLISSKSDKAAFKTINTLTKQYNGVKLGFKLNKAE